MSEEEKRFGNNIISYFDGISYRQRRELLKYFLNFLTLIGVVLILFPLYWMVVTSLRPSSLLFSRSAPLFPAEFTLNHFSNVIFSSDFARYYTNSLIVASGVVVLTTAIATLGGYGLTRIDIPHKKKFARLILFGYMFPAILLAIPMFILWRQIGIINSYLGLVLAETALALPFCLWMMWKFFQTVPTSLEESARMAGASRFRAFYEIALPNAKPGIIAISIFSFAISWNAYTTPKIIMPQEEKWPITIGLYSYTVQNKILWGDLMAASVLALIPPFLFIFFLQKYLLAGFKAGGT